MNISSQTSNEQAITLSGPYGFLRRLLLCIKPGSTMNLEAFNTELDEIKEIVEINDELIGLYLKNNQHLNMLKGQVEEDAK